MPVYGVDTTNLFDLLDGGEEDVADGEVPQKKADAPARVKTDKKDKVPRAEKGAAPPKAKAAEPVLGAKSERPKKHDGYDRRPANAHTDKREKRGGAGKYNWGKDGEEFEKPRRAAKAPKKEEEEAPAAAEPVPEVVAVEEIVEVVAVEEEPSAPEYSLDEYLKMKQAARPADDNKEAREVTVDAKRFKAGTAVESQKKAKAAVEEEQPKEKKAAPKKAVAAGKMSLQDFYSVVPATSPAPRASADSESKGGEARRGRGGARGGRGGSSERGGASERGAERGGRGRGRGRGGGEGGRGRGGSEGGRGRGRGGGEGGRGRGGSRGGPRGGRGGSRPDGAAAGWDESAFPKLGGK